jgi:hypothetical protein
MGSYSKEKERLVVRVAPHSKSEVTAIRTLRSLPFQFLMNDGRSGGTLGSSSSDRSGKDVSHIRIVWSSEQEAKMG